MIWGIVQANVFEVVVACLARIFKHCRLKYRYAYRPHDAWFGFACVDEFSVNPFEISLPIDLHFRALGEGFGRSYNKPAVYENQGANSVGSCDVFGRFIVAQWGLAYNPRWLELSLSPLDGSTGFSFFCRVFRDRLASYYQFDYR